MTKCHAKANVVSCFNRNIGYNSLQHRQTPYNMDIYSIKKLCSPSLWYQD